MHYQILILLFLLHSCSQAQSPVDFDEKLELISANSIKQLATTNNERFDLSGIVKYKDAIYVMADKQWNNHIYKIDTSDTQFKIVSSLELSIDGIIDFEGIDICDDKFYFIEEWYNNVYTTKLSSSKIEKLDIPWQKHGIEIGNWGNKGFEGIACDCMDNIIYLAKERQPRRIFKVDLNRAVITEPFANYINSESQGFDIADMKYENGALYILERGKGLITKIDVKSNEKYSVSYQHIVFKNNQRLFKNKNPEYGMAEALLLTESEIWVGLDNNGDKVSKYGKSKGLKGNQPVILIFKRPKNF